MNSVEKVKTICKKRKIPISKLEKDLGFANGYIGQLRKGTFPNDRIVAISEYLNVSLSYLLGESDNPTSEEKPAAESGSELDATTKELLNLAATLDPADVHMLLDMAKAIKARRKDDEK